MTECKLSVYADVFCIWKYVCMSEFDNNNGLIYIVHRVQRVVFFVKMQQMFVEINLQPADSVLS